MEFLRYFNFLTKSLVFWSEESVFGLLFSEKLVCFWSVISIFWSVLIIGNTGVPILFLTGHPF